jgi:hypothetical protein
LLRGFPSFTRDWIEFDLPMDEGWVYIAWLTENDGWLQFSGVKRDSPGFIAQEAERILNAK